jgi:hypothetical protein
VAAAASMTTDMKKEALFEATKKGMYGMLCKNHRDPNIKNLKSS